MRCIGGCCSLNEIFTTFGNLAGMQIIHAATVRHPKGNPSWCARIFDAKAARTGGIVHRAVRDVEREIGRPAFVQEVGRRGFHLVECGGQFIVICNAGNMIVHT
jgi:hypothetical protein